MFLRFCTGLLRLPTDAKSRKGFNVNIKRHVPVSSARPGRAAAVNPDGYALATSDAPVALFSYFFSSAADYRTRKRAFALWNGPSTPVKLCEFPCPPTDAQFISGLQHTHFLYQST